MNPTARLHVEALDVDLGVGEVVRRLAGRERVTAWSGVWSPGALVTCDPVRVADASEDPFALLTDLPAVEPEPACPAAVGGGWFGYLSFPASRPGATHPAAPRCSLAFYRDVLRHDGERWWYEALLSEDGCSGTLGFDRTAAGRRHAELSAALATPSTVAPARLELLHQPDATAHVVAVERCIQAIRRGEIYQANIAGHLDLALRGSPHDAWARLVEERGPARAALVADPMCTAVSASPELFLRRSGRRVRTAPIKGTRPRVGRRVATPTGAGTARGQPSDAAERARLRDSAKDAAENVMIVDLMRNDLARVCATGSVRVPSLLEVEPHAGVWHLVSTVTGELAPGCDDADLLAATFPPGSVTGAPKLRAVEVIEELEARPRGLFTGAMGFASPLAGLELNVAIRTLEVAPGGRAVLGVGGGVTVDSTPVEEWAECLTKAGPVLSTLGTHVPPPGLDGPGLARRADGIFETLLVRDGRPRLGEHLRRLRASYVECYGVPLTADVEAAVAAAVRAATKNVMVAQAPGSAMGAAAVWAPDPAMDVAVMGRPGDAERRADTGADQDRSRLLRVRVEARPEAPHRVHVVAVPVTPPVALDAQPGLVLRSYRLGPAGGERHKFVDRRWLDAAEAGLRPDEAALLVDDTGRLLETTRSCVFVVRAGVPATPPLDGRILPGTARRAVLDTLDGAGTHYDLVAATLGELAAADGMFLVNAVRGVQWVRAAPGVEWPEPDPATRSIAKLLDRD